MIFDTGSAPLDTIVLIVVSRDVERTHGYKITRGVRQTIDISEFTLYLMLRCFQREDCLEVYDMVIDGGNHRCYRLAERGKVQLNLYQEEWVTYSQKISRISREARL